jgi:hypothetical protein
MATVLERLTEGTTFHNKSKESAALLAKWEKSGLLEGIKDDHNRGVMATLLENQAKELLREANAMSAGDVQGFASVAFPIVRRVFAGLIANDLVSVQPMSLPNGLVFFLDFKYGTDLGFADDKVRTKTESIYGDRVGQEVRQGVRLTGYDEEGRDNAAKGYYNLGNGFGTARIVVGASGSELQRLLDPTSMADLTSAQKKLIRWDADLLADTTHSASVYQIPFSHLPYSELIAENDVYSVSIVSGTVASDGVVVPPSAEAWETWANLTGSVSVVGPVATGAKIVHRLTQVVTSETIATDGLPLTVGKKADKALQFVVLTPSATAIALLATNGLLFQLPIKDQIQSADAAGGLGALVAQQPWTLEGARDLPEIQLKVDSFSITARSRKLKAAWTPELGQDLNAYHNLDAEVELTSLLSEQIGLEIDQEILNDLIKGATGATKYWSRRPGKFVNRRTGVELNKDPTGTLNYAAPPDFTGNVSMWYETLLETINDVSADIHRKTLRGAANFIVVSPEVANILEFTAGFRATVTHDSDKGSTGAVKVGALNSKFDVIVDPYFPRNVILVGRKGASFLESGFVYAPYVPLQTSPTIFDPQDFTPRKSVMTRYGKTMVRPDMYGLVIVTDLEG